MNPKKGKAPFLGLVPLGGNLEPQKRGKGHHWAIKVRIDGVLVGAPDTLSDLVQALDGLGRCVAQDGVVIHLIVAQ